MTKEMFVDLLSLLELVIDLVQILDPDTMGHHLQRIDLAALNALEEVFPVEVDGCLAIADEADSTLHERACSEVSTRILGQSSLKLLTNVKVICVPDVDTSDTDATVVLHALDHLVQNLTRIRLESSRELDGV